MFQICLAKLAFQICALKPQHTGNRRKGPVRQNYDITTTTTTPTLKVYHTAPVSWPWHINLGESLLGDDVFGTFLLQGVKILSGLKVCLVSKDLGSFLETLACIGSGELDLRFRLIFISILGMRRRDNYGKIYLSCVLYRRLILMMNLHKTWKKAFH